MAIFYAFFGFMCMQVKQYHVVEIREEVQALQPVSSLMEFQVVAWTTIKQSYTLNVSSWRGTAMADLFRPPETSRFYPNFGGYQKPKLF